MSTVFKDACPKKGFSWKVLIFTACSFLVGGFLLSAGFKGTESAAAVPRTAPALESVSSSSVVGSFSSLADKVRPTVVNIRVNKIEKTDFGSMDMPENQSRDFFEWFLNRGPIPRERPVLGAGSGVIINSDGTILTNNHVVEGAGEITVTLDDKNTYKAKLVGRDPKTDLAVLKINADKELPAAPLGDSEDLRVGDWVMAIGNPFGLGQTVTSGIVSAKGRVIGAGPYDDFIQTDASINPGNSGGPLFNMSGEVVGINTAILSSGQGIGFAIPVNTAKPLIPQLIEHGRVTRGYLGVNIQNVTPELAKAMNIEEDKGALVADVLPGTPAEQAGIKRGDVITRFNGKKVVDSHSLPSLVAAAPVGTEATLTILREGKELEMKVKIGRLPDEKVEQSKSTDQPAPGKWGLSLQELDPQAAKDLGLMSDKGVLVAGVVPGSPADEASIRQGEVILEVNRKAVDSIAQIKEELSKVGEKENILLLVQGEKGTRYVILKG